MHKQHREHLAITFIIYSSSQEPSDCLFCLKAAHAHQIMAKLLQNTYLLVC